MSEYRMMALTEEEAAAFKEMLADYAETKQQREKEKKNDGWTKEKIMAEKDTLKRQRLIKEHWELFSSK